MRDGPRVTAKTEVLLLGSIGALLVFIEGIAQLAIGASFSQVIPYSSLGVIIWVGLLNLVLGVVLWWLCFAYYVRPERGGVYGAGMVIAAAFTLWLGGGFLVGLILALLGGLLAILLPARAPLRFPTEDWDTAPVDSDRTPTFSSAQHPLPGLEARGVVTRYCPHCWTENRPEATVCGHCNSGLPHPSRPSGPATT